ncbi:8307_t:CDS:2 [Funneliformis mosseae]|uniref:8307_t:CDS:1 n=1 Tax=Funneliformis mosseae TaxID=27381 RepID=A0A9N9CNA2_FUNMO|nr:8307_t:CDS:2 [Funneliformis mosseae]
MVIGNSNCDYSNVIDKDDENYGGLNDECVIFASYNSNEDKDKMDVEN